MSYTPSVDGKIISDIKNVGACFNPKINGTIDKTIYVVEIPIKNIKNISFDVCTQPSLAPGKMLKTYENQPDVLTNLGFFATSTGNSIFNIVSNSVVISRNEDKNYSNCWGIDSSNKEEIKLDFGHYLSMAHCQNVITAYPALIMNKIKMDYSYASELDYAAKRTVWGWTDKYIYHMAISSKIKFNKLVEIIETLYPDTIFAGNMDGGGSACQYVNGKRTDGSGWERPVDTVCALWVKESEPSILYTVQLGAFTKKENADRFLKEIQAIKTKVHDYSDAYVKKIDKYYKVQVGAFSKKENANRMAEDLEGLGYTTYITKKEI